MTQKLVRKIRVFKWVENVTTPDGNVNSARMDSIQLMRLMVLNVHPSKLPQGLEAFEVMKGLHNALTNAKGQEYIVLEEPVFEWIKKNVFEQIPASWGLNPDISEAVDNIIDPPKELLEEEKESEETETLAEEKDPKDPKKEKDPKKSSR